MSAIFFSMIWSVYFIPYLKAWRNTVAFIPAISSYLRHILMAGYTIPSLAGC